MIEDSKEILLHIERVANAATNLALLACLLEADGEQEDAVWIVRAQWDDLQASVAAYKSAVDALLAQVDKEVDR